MSPVGSIDSKCPHYIGLLDPSQGVRVKPKPDRQVFEELTSLTTEGRNADSVDLDRLDTAELLRLLNREDATVAEAVAGEIPQIEQAVELVVEAFRAGHRLIYVGAGTSGRLGVADAAECPPTFGADPETVQAIMAGGEEALVRAVEGAEDDAEAGAQAVRDRKVGPGDVVLGIAASRRTPFVLAAVAEARYLGARTVYLTMNPRDSIDFEVDAAICPVVGPEVLMGSTRMKSALAQRMVLTMITTAAFVRVGKVYENMMVDLSAGSAKLRERGKRVVMTVTGCDYETAADALTRADGSVKTAIVMLLSGVGAEEAEKLLSEAGGFVRGALERAPGGRRSDAMGAGPSGGKGTTT
jgi:N-acetylmuramic acid 6-phosphate etherase